MRKKFVASTLSIITVALLGVTILSFAQAAQAEPYINPHYCMSDEVCYPNNWQGGYNAEDLAKIGLDLSQNGEKSQYYYQFKTYMDAYDASGTLRLKNGGGGDTVKFRLIGINHDDRADGKGKAGLTFLTTDSSAILAHQMEKKQTELYGGWRDSKLRRDLNKGDIWGIMPDSLKQYVIPVVKQSGTNMARYMQTNATAEKLTLMSYKELVDKSHWGNNISLNQEGTQYAFFKDRVKNNADFNAILDKNNWVTDYDYKWERSAYPDDLDGLGVELRVLENGNPSGALCDVFDSGIAPAFSF